MKRRDWLARGAFFSVAAASGALAHAQGVERHDGDDGDDRDERHGGWRDDPALPVAFPQGVASGDPRDTSVVFWTRCVPVQHGHRPARHANRPVPLRLQVFRDRGCRDRVAEVRLWALPEFDHTVRVKVKHLQPGTVYHYRFVAGRQVSEVGRTKTAPAPHATPVELKFAWFTCQDWTVNHWAAMDLLAQGDHDFLVHVGDYIYETVDAAFQAGAAEPAHGAITFPDGTAMPGGARYATTLADYRHLYKTYRSDARLQRVHARFPLIATWDDHEFSDDAWQDHQTYTNGNLQQTQRRRAANQAWVEYMPVDFGDVAFDSSNAAFDNLRIYRDFRFGKLAHLVMTDQRLYRDDHVVPEAVIAEAQGHDPINGSDSIGARYFIQQPVLAQFEALKTQAMGRAPSILGTTQTAWWKQTMQSSPAVWKLWGNELMLSRLWLDLRTQAPPPYNALYVVNGDAWDGYPRHKAELLGFLKDNAVRNVVALTGDLHAFQCGVVRDVPDVATGTPVLVDFVCAGISSSSFYSYVKAGSTGTPLAALTASPAVFDAVLRAHNPDFAYVDHDAQGFASAVVTSTHLVVTYHKVNRLQGDGTLPPVPLAKRTRITLVAGTTTPLIEDNV